MTTTAPTMEELMQMLISQQTNHQEFIKNMGTRSTTTKPQLTAPRLGGQNVTGIWTGSGASGLLEEPNSTNCMRTFDTDVIKNHQAMSPIEDRCKKGLRDSPELLFCMPDEPNAGTIVNSIRALEDHLTLCGMEGAFQIFQPTPTGITTLHMLQSPGRITTEIVDAWCKATLVDGIPKAQPQRITWSSCCLSP